MLECGNKNAHNPLLDPNWGRVCLPPDGDGTMENEVISAAVLMDDYTGERGYLVRCCGDLGWNCLKCPHHSRTAEEMARISTLANPAGDEAYDSLGNILDSNGDINTTSFK